MTDPKRLVHPASGSSHELRALLVAARADLPDAQRLTAIAATARVATASTAASGAGATAAKVSAAGGSLGAPAAGAGVAGALKVGLAGIAVAGFVATGTWWIGTHGSASMRSSGMASSATVTGGRTLPPPIAMTPPAFPVIPAPSGALAEHAEVEPATPPSISVPPAATHAAPARPPATTSDAPAVDESSARGTVVGPAEPRGGQPFLLGASPSAAPALSGAPPPDSPAPLSEVDLLRTAEEELRRDPVSALALADQHAQRFPNGMLTQEREVVAIEALVRLGRMGEGRIRAERFLQSAPGTAYRLRVEALVNDGANASFHNP